MPGSRFPGTGRYTHVAIDETATQSTSFPAFTGRLSDVARGLVTGR
jgi:hypothetical protein